MGTAIDIPPTWGAGDGYGGNLPLERNIDDAFVLDARRLRKFHPMFVIRLRLFIDWHLAAGHEVLVRGPEDHDALQRLANLGLGDGLPDGVVDLPADKPDGGGLVPVRSLRDFHGVEDLANEVIELVEAQELEVANWGNALHMGIGELCENGLTHGKHELGVYVVADRIEEPQRTIRLAVADLGIGIPEHIRMHYPEWQDDSAAIARALYRGVSGTGDKHRGNGFAEILDQVVQAGLVRSNSAAQIDIRSARGHVQLEHVGGVTNSGPIAVRLPRRGTWIEYTIKTA